MVFLRSLLNFVVFAVVVSAVNSTDLSPERAERLNIEAFSKNSKEGHVMPPASFFLQQLKNMCHEFEHETLAYYLCSHLTEGQKYVVPILDYHEDDEKDEHVFMVELMPRKVYYHADSPVAITSTSDQAQDMQVLIPKQHVPSDRLKSLAKDFSHEAR